MNEILIANLTLDTYRKNNVPPLIVPQGDYGARVIRVTITEQGKPVSVESTAAVSIVSERSGDGTAQAFSGEVNNDGSVTVPVTQWMLDVPDDDVICHVVVTGNGYQYSTTSFLIEPQAKPNPTEISADDPRVDVVTEVLANENARQAAETTRTANENARKTAENSRQSAETQRLTDEATRVANEAQRVSAESSRDATFKSWANDIALLPDMSARISRNSKRLDGLEQRIKPSPFDFDETVAYQKDVPINAVGAAAIHKIGSMTYKDGNTLRSAPVTAVKSVGVNLCGAFSFIEGFVTALKTENISVKANTDYTVQFFGDDNLYIVYVVLANGTNVVQKPDITSGFTATFNTGNNTELFLQILTKKDVTDTSIYKAMLNEGDAQPYTPYVEHTLPIPEAVRPANGINSEVYDSIEWGEDGKQRKRVKCGVADLSTLSWAAVLDTYAYTPRIYKPNAVCICIVPSTITEIRIDQYGALLVFYKSGTFASVEELRTAMSGVMLVYELAEPIVTDISDLITSDNLLPIEGGGTLTFENEYGYDVPSTVEYITAESDE